MARTGKPADRHIESVQRAIAVLDTLAAAGHELGTTEIARRTGVNISTVSRLLATLASSGIVQYLPGTGRYRLGIRVLQLASAARETLDVRTLVRPFLEEITEISRETSTLSVPGEHDVMTLDFVQSPSSVRSVAEIGRNSVRHATAVGKVFLAHGGRAPEELTRFTERTICDHRALAAEIDAVRRQGWAVARAEREPDLNGVAVPVCDQRGNLVAILGVQGPAGRLDEAATDAARDLLADRAATISAAF